MAIITTIPTSPSIPNITRNVNSIHISGSNLQPYMPEPAFSASFITLQLGVFTTYREVVVRGSTGKVDFIHDICTMCEPPRTYRFPVAYLAEPALTKPVFKGLDIGDLERVALYIHCYAMEHRSLRVEARVEVVIERVEESEESGACSVCLEDLSGELVRSTGSEETCILSWLSGEDDC